MARNGSGTYSRAVSSYVYNTVIDQVAVNAEMDDIATALTASLAKDGQTVPTANLPMGGYKLTGLGAGSAAGNSLRYEQLFTTSAVQLLGAIDWVKGANIASAATINLTTATGNGVHVTGTTQIDAVTLGTGMLRLVVFDGILTLTHHATNNNLPRGANITTAAGDRAIYWADGTTVYCVAYQPAAGYQPYGASIPTVAASQAEMEAGTEAALRSMSPLRVAQAIAILGTPAGTIIDFGGSAAPAGYLACDGSAVSRTTYATLFAAVGTLWGVGDGSTTFNIPNFSAGWASVQSAGTVGASTTGEVKAHTHTETTLGAGVVASAGANYQNTSGTTGSTGGTHNLAGGNYVFKCIKT